MGSSLFRSSSRMMPALLYALAYLMMASAKETHLHSNASFVGGSLSDDTGFYADDTLMRKAGISSEVERTERSSLQDPREKRRLHLLPRALLSAPNFSFRTPRGSYDSSMVTSPSSSGGGFINAFRSDPSMTGAAMPAMNIDPYESYWGDGGNAPDMQVWQGSIGSYGSMQQPTIYPQQQATMGSGYGPMTLAAGGPPGTIAGTSPYAGYLEKQIASYPIMIYTLNDCIPCQRAKQLLALHYPDVRAHFLELSGNEPWQQQLQVDLQYLTGAITFPYIFVCGQYIGGSSDLFELHESGQLRRMVSQCLKTAVPKA